MAATMFFPPPSMPTANPDHLPNEILDDENDELSGDRISIIHHHHQMHHHHHHNNTPDGDDTIHHHVSATERHQCDGSGRNEVLASNAGGETSSLPQQVPVEEDGGEEEDEDVEHNDEGPLESHRPSAITEVSATGSGVDIGTLIGRRVTLKPRRTLSLSPTPARAGDMMARNLRAARWLDFTNEDDDDGLYQPSDSDSEGKRKTIKEEMASVGRVRVTTRRGGSLGSLTVGAAMSGLSREVFSSRRGSSSMKRPLEVTLPCQEIQYLDISYQKVGIHAVQFSPIPRKKIAYHPVPYHAIHYCDVPYLGERPVKRKPPA